MSLWLTPGTGAVVVLGQCFISKFFMTAAYRAPAVLNTKKENDMVTKSDAYNLMRSTQLNDAEWGPLLFSGLMYLHTQKIDAPYTATMCAVGAVGYYYARVGFGSPFYIPFALLRYGGTFLMLTTIYNSL